MNANLTNLANLRTNRTIGGLLAIFLIIVANAEMQRNDAEEDRRSVRAKYETRMRFEAKERRQRRSQRLAA
jgi:hypothetical protein